MGDRKNIDRFFQENFKDFEVTPDPHVWAAIAERMGKKKGKNRRIYPFIIRYGGIAAAIALLISLGYNLNTSDTLTPENNNFTNTNTKNNSNETTPTYIENTPQDKNAVVTNGEKRNNENTPRYIPVNNTDASKNVASDYNNRNTVDPNASGRTGIYPETGNAIAENTPVRQENDRIEETDPAAGTDNKKSILDAIRDTDTAEEKAVVQTHPGKWSVSPNAAPVYFNSLENGSPIAGQFSDNTKSGNVTMSYGVNVAYHVNDRLSVRSGVNRVNYGYNTNNIEFSATLQGRNISTIEYNNTAQNIVIADVNTSNPHTPPGTVSANKGAAYEGRMLQELGYVEVPVEVKYRLLDKKLGINVIGGVSSLFLTDNDISLQTDVHTTRIGEANNINDVNFSTNIGLGIDYEFSDRVLFNVEPMFKYQLNTFSNEDGGFKPYALGIYTGLSFRF